MYWIKSFFLASITLSPIYLKYLRLNYHNFLAFALLASSVFTFNGMPIFDEIFLIFLFYFFFTLKKINIQNIKDNYIFFFLVYILIINLFSENDLNKLRYLFSICIFLFFIIFFDFNLNKFHNNILNWFIIFLSIYLIQGFILEIFILEDYSRFSFQDVIIQGSSKFFLSLFLIYFFFCEKNYKYQNNKIIFFLVLALVGVLFYHSRFGLIIITLILIFNNYINLKNKLKILISSYVIVAIITSVLSFSKIQIYLNNINYDLNLIDNKNIVFDDHINKYDRNLTYDNPISCKLSLKLKCFTELLKLKFLRYTWGQGHYDLFYSVYKPLNQVYINNKSQNKNISTSVITKENIFYKDADRISVVLNSIQIWKNESLSNKVFGGGIYYHRTKNFSQSNRISLMPTLLIDYGIISLILLHLIFSKYFLIIYNSKKINLKNKLYYNFYLFFLYLTFFINYSLEFFTLYFGFFLLSKKLNQPENV